MSEDILMMIIMLPVAFLMLGIGIYQMKSQKPAGFYSGVEPPKPEEITDLRAWNLKHGGMWVVYGAVIAVTTVVATFVLGGAWCAICFTGGIMLPLPFMVWYHHRLMRIYIKK